MYVICIILETINKQERKNPKISLMYFEGFPYVQKPPVICCEQTTHTRVVIVCSFTDSLPVLQPVNHSH